MQTHRLNFHPAFHPAGVRQLAVRWGRLTDGRIMLRYRLDGCEGLVLPPPRAPVRADELWRTTCFELFLADPGGHYREYNFSPDGRWAAYAFAGYRNRIGNHDPVLPPEIAVEIGRSVLTVTVFLSGDELAGATRAALTAVAEEQGGRLSYWASKHPGLKPDFHDPTCFVLPVP